MGKVKNWMMDIEEFCDGYFYGGDSEFTIEEVADDAPVADEVDPNAGMA